MPTMPGTAHQEAVWPAHLLRDLDHTAGECGSWNYICSEELPALGTTPLRTIMTVCTKKHPMDSYLFQKMAHHKKPLPLTQNNPSSIEIF